MLLHELNGEWKITAANNRVAGLKATIPGTVHTALEENKMLENFYWRDNPEKYHWIEETGWIFEKEFILENIPPEVVLVLEGVDTYADVYINGNLLCSLDDMFITHKHTVCGMLVAGVNTIKIVFTPPDIKTEGVTKLGAAFSWQRLYTRRVQCTYGWDWVARIVTMGIIKPIYLEIPDETQIDTYHIYTSSIDNDYAQVKLDVEFSRVSAEDTFLETRILNPNGELVYSDNRLIVEDHIYSTIDIEDAELWYPNGYGKQNLYTLELSVTKGKEILSKKAFEFGIRMIRIECRRDKVGSEYYNKCKEFLEENKNFDDTMIFEKNKEYFGFIIHVNNIPIMCKGADWVPCESFKFHNNDKKVEKLISLAHDAHFNYLRIWGGGVFEEEELYNQCDKLGILVAQDFLMACGTYPEDDEFLEKFKAEAEFAVKKLRNHACLCYLSGDNENAIAANDNKRIYSGRKIVRKAIEPIVHKYDSVTTFIPSSPYGGDTYGSSTAGTAHNTGRILEKSILTRTGDMNDFEELYDHYISRFNCEEPIFGAPSERSLKKFMSDEDIYGQDRTMWKYHTRNNPCGDFLNYDLFDYHEISASKILGEFKSPEDRLMKLQYLEYETVRKSMSLFRRNKWFSSGVSYWMFNDIWPRNSWSIIDYYCIPKAGYYSFKKYAKPVISAVEYKNNKYNFIVCNDSLEDVEGDLNVSVENFKGLSNKWHCKFRVKANSSVNVFSIEAEEMQKYSDETSIIFSDIKTGFGEDTSIRYITKPANVNFPKAKVSIIEKTKDYISIKSDKFVLALRLEGEFEFSDNYFMLKPGEEKKIFINGDESEEITIYSLYN